MKNCDFLKFNKTEIRKFNLFLTACARIELKDSFCIYLLCGLTAIPEKVKI